MKRVLAILFGLLAFAAFAIFGALLVMPEDDLAAVVQPLPVVGPYSEQIVEIKISVSNAAAYFVDDTIYSVKSTWRDVAGFSLTDRSQKVVIELEPVRDRTVRAPKAAPVAVTKTPAPLSPISNEPAQIAAVPTEPEPEPTNTTEPMPQDAAKDMAEPLDSQSAAPAPPVEPEPMEAQPTTPVTEPAQPVQTEPVEMSEKTEMAAVQPTQPVTPKPETTSKPPAPPKVDMGVDAHKKGLTYYKGLGEVTKNFKKASEWFHKGAEKGNPSSQYNLGIMAYLGQGADQSFEQAADWFRQAAKQDHALAQYNLGFLYYEGKGVEKDDLQAFMWIDRAARQGDEKAIAARDTLEKVLPKSITSGQ